MDWAGVACWCLVRLHFFCFTPQPCLAALLDSSCQHLKSFALPSCSLLLFPSPQKCPNKNLSYDKKQT